MGRLALLLGMLVMFVAVTACGDQEVQPEVRIVEVEKTVIVEKEVVKEVVVTPTPLPPGPKTLVVCQGQEPTTLYLYGSSMLAARHVQHALYDGPIDNKSYSYQPVILEKLPSIKDGDAEVRDVTVQPGEIYANASGQLVEAQETVETQQIVVTFKLKKGVTWEDGEPVTVHDSVYSFNLAADPDTPAPKFTIHRTANYEALDDYTVRWTSIPGFIDAVYFTNFWTPLPEHAMAHLSAAEILDSGFARDPLSYGAFVLEEWVPGDHITLKKNLRYFRADEGLPKVDTLVFRFIPDTNQLLVELLAGGCDIGTQDGLSLDQSPLLLQARDYGLLQPYFVTGTVWEHIDFNVSPTDRRVPIGACLAVRRAIAYGTDRQAMVDQVLYGQSEVFHSYIPQEHPMYLQEIPTYTYAPEQAMRILSRAGWIDLDGDGVREAHGVTCERVNFDTQKVEKIKIPDGTPLQLTLNTTADNKMREMVTELFQKNMEAIGVDIELEYLPTSVYYAEGPEGPLFGRRFDLAEFAWLTSVEPPGYLYLCSEVPSRGHGWGGSNETGWCSLEYEAATNQALGTLAEEDQRRFWAASQRIFAENLPALPLFARIKVAVTRPEVTGFVIDPTENSEMVNVEAFDISR